MYFLKKAKYFGKRDFLGPTHRFKNTMFFGFREKGGARFELKIREKGYFSRAPDVGAYT